jgi:hypothetical protein
MTKHDWGFPGHDMSAAWTVAIKFESMPLQLAVWCNMKFEMKDYI